MRLTSLRLKFNVQPFSPLLDVRKQVKERVNMGRHDEHEYDRRDGNLLHILLAFGYVGLISVLSFWLSLHLVETSCENIMEHSASPSIRLPPRDVVPKLEDADGVVQGLP